MLLTGRNVPVITWVLTSELSMRFLVLFGHKGDVRNVLEILVEIPRGKSFGRTGYGWLDNVNSSSRNLDAMGQGSD
jgi:hypothetical protein